MKQSKNRTLIIGIICNSIFILWRIIGFVSEFFYDISIDGQKGYLFDDILPIFIYVLLIIIPVVLLIRNLKNKTGKVLPIISIIVNGIILLGVLFTSFTPAIPQYLIYSEIGLINTYFVTILSFFRYGGILFVTGYVLLVVGSFLSLPKDGK